MIGWYSCELCNSTGRLDIGDNFNKFKKIKNLQCPVCGGKGRLAIKPIIDYNHKRFQRDDDERR